MSEEPRELSPRMQALAAAIRDRPVPPKAVFCGFDLWLEVCGSGHTATCNFKAGGEIATGDEPENTVLVPVLVIGKRIVVGFDPTLPPGEFRLKTWALLQPACPIMLNPLHWRGFEMPGAARTVMDKVMQDSPHCHAPIHPPAPTPTPVPHACTPLMIIGPGAPTVLINKMPAARVTDSTVPCMLIPCVPAGPGMIVKGSTTVLIAKMPAARAGDITAHPTCVAPIPSPTGKILPPCSVTVSIGG